MGHSWFLFKPVVSDKSKTHVQTLNIQLNGGSQRARRTGFSPVEIKISAPEDSQDVTANMSSSEVLSPREQFLNSGAINGNDGVTDRNHVTIIPVEPNDTLNSNGDGTLKSSSCSLENGVDAGHDAETDEEANYLNDLVSEASCPLSSV